MPIGNLTSQIFANIYFHEFDRFVKHTLKPQAYMRYGDDFIMIDNLQNVNVFRKRSIDFLQGTLKLRLNPKSDKIFKANHGLKFLGVMLWPTGRKLNKRNIRRINERLDTRNAASYRGLIFQHESKKNKKCFHWLFCEKI